MPSRPKADEPTLPLSDEQRRRRVAEVRALDRELAVVESTLLDALARLPGLIERVRSTRAVIERNTAPPGDAETEG